MRRAMTDATVSVSRIRAVVPVHRMSKTIKALQLRQNAIQLKNSALGAGVRCHMLKAGANQNRIGHRLLPSHPDSRAADPPADSAPSESAISGDWPNNAICMSFPPSSNAEVIKTNTFTAKLHSPSIASGYRGARRPLLWKIAPSK